ncbi:FAD binding domain-containing protein [Thermanaerovibrio acidaminovorans]|jgi:carbon-monoxide dehydrogenase medium subunit|uniref:Molybdopterin dehydrogenase FAD-binding protein n=1 Tax=Thermanaerovibrio acidaminovorans (strain ATCC 49978 / DSM 6589 / Su883) TaxID=525903 RepID=D1B830_THEAS|nr:FAD binding domain-containing protein [Thermanaerovibrio acidaminovorans]ACZ18433.1 molybdopterin dehydrogenase FAD-binding protein [Thermanaerovibrio acidaminovorans DSM 6589]
MTHLKPTSLDQLVKSVACAPEETRYIAGGTDLVPQINRHGLPGPLVDLTSVPELRRLQLGDQILLSSGVTFAEVAQASVPQGLRDMASMVGSPQIRNRGTLGGNVANLSPAADAVPMLLALDARVEVLNPRDHMTRLEPLEGLLSTRGRVVQSPLDLIVSFRVTNRWDISFFGKVGSRRQVTISKLNLAFAADLGSNVCRVFMGAIGPTPVRCPQAEEAILALKGRDLMEQLPRILSRAVEMAIPTRASMPYKRRAVMGLGEDLARCILTHGR